MSITIKFDKTKSPYSGGILKNKLIELRGHKCEDCGLTQWKNQPIPLEAHHIDGDRCNNTLENLLLLCPNCHTLTPNYGSRNNKHKEISDEELLAALKKHSSIRQALFSLGLSDAGANYKRVRNLITNNPTEDILLDNHEYIYICEDCGKYISKNAKYCPECAKKHARIVERPTRKELKNLIRTTPFTKIGKQFGVSDNAIRKWCKIENLPSKVKDIKQYTDEAWELL